MFDLINANKKGVTLSGGGQWRKKVHFSLCSYFSPGLQESYLLKGHNGTFLLWLLKLRWQNDLHGVSC